MRGDAKGVFSDVEILVGVAIDPKGNNEFLTRPDNGMFSWGERTMTKLESVTAQDKYLKLVLSIFALFLNMMLDLNGSLSQGSFFEEFMNDFNLMTKIRS